MLDQKTRSAILKLHEKGLRNRAIARALKVSRESVKAVLTSGSAEVPTLARQEKAADYLDEVRRLHAQCKGNLVRVHEELCTTGAELSYPALTAFCRRHGIGHEPPKPEGRYDFRPGQEMQHDTSPHVAHIGGRERAVQTASLVYCCSRLQFFQMYPRFTRFECKVFLDEGIRYAGGSAAD